MLTRPTPADFNSTAARQAQSLAFAHLVDRADARTHLAALMERTAKLAPVSRAWDPDIEDLLELTLFRLTIRGTPIEGRRIKSIPRT